MQWLETGIALENEERTIFLLKLISKNKIPGHEICTESSEKKKTKKPFTGFDIAEFILKGLSGRLT